MPPTAESPLLKDPHPRPASSSPPAGWPWWLVVLAHIGLPGVVDGGINYVSHGARKWLDSERTFTKEDWTIMYGEREGRPKARPTLRLTDVELIVRLSTGGYETFDWTDISGLNGGPKTSYGILDSQVPVSDTARGAYPISITTENLHEFLKKHAEKYPDASAAVKEGRDKFFKKYARCCLLQKYGWIAGGLVQAVCGVYIRRKWDTEDTSEGWAKWGQMLLELVIRFGIQVALTALFPGSPILAWLLATGAQVGLTFLWPHLRRGARSLWGWLTSRP